MHMEKDKNVMRSLKKKKKNWNYTTLNSIKKTEIFKSYHAIAITKKV